MVRDLVDGAARRATTSLDLSVYRQCGNAVVVIGDDGEDHRQPDAGAPRSGDDCIEPHSVSETVTQHGGTITVDDRPGVGTFVTVTLPSTRQR